MTPTNTKTTHDDKNSVTAQAESALFALASAVADLRQQLNAVTQRKAELLERRKMLFDAPLSQADIRQFVCELIDHRAAAYVDRLNNYQLADKLTYPARNGTVSHNGKQPINFEDAEAALGRELGSAARKDNLDGSGWKLPIFLSYGEFEGWPYFFFGSMMKEKLCAVLADMQSAPKDGTSGTAVPSMDERRKEIAAISVEVRQLDAKAGSLRTEIGRLSNPVFSSAKRLQNQAVGAE